MTTTLSSRPGALQRAAQAFVPGSSASGGPDVDEWSVIFVLSRALEDTVCDRIIDGLGRPAAYLFGPKPALGVRGRGSSMEEVLSDVVDVVTPPLLAEADLEILEVHMIPHTDAARQLAERRPLRYYGVTETARSLGITRQRVHQLRSEQKMLEPHAEIAGKPAWDADVMDAYGEMRRRLLKQTPLGCTLPIPELYLVGWDEWSEVAVTDEDLES